MRPIHPLGRENVQRVPGPLGEVRRALGGRDLVLLGSRHALVASQNLSMWKLHDENMRTNYWGSSEFSVQAFGLIVVPSAHSYSCFQYYRHVLYTRAFHPRVSFRK